MRAKLKRSHAGANLFERYKNSLGVSGTVVLDVCTRFDSTVDMFESIFKNQSVLERMQEVDLVMGLYGLLPYILQLIISCI